MLALLEGDYALSVARVNVLEGEDSEKIKQMKTFSGANTVPQVNYVLRVVCSLGTYVRGLT